MTRSPDAVVGAKRVLRAAHSFMLRLHAKNTMCLAF